MVHFRVVMGWQLNAVKVVNRMRGVCTRLFWGGVLILSTIQVARAEMRSDYSSLDLNECPLVAEAQEGEGEWAVFRCTGIRGVPVFVSESDLRISLGYGPDGQTQQSMSQHLSAFNTIGGKLEWRLKEGQIVATILRYNTDTGSGDAARKGQILVVSRVSAGFSEACHVAYIDALANPGANVLARYAADYLAPKFNCRTDQAIRLGRQGVSPF